jgi:putative ABC transport system substrate-binding protein
MRRREVITLLGGATVWPVAARSEQVRGVKRLAILYDGSEAVGGSDIAVFRQGLERAGWSEGRTLRITVRWGDGRADRIRAAAA